jgi:GNAT superfamily N-acetyltransferase
MIALCTQDDLLDMHAVINDAARAYRGVIPADRWKEPYMPFPELQHEIASGVRFWGYRLNNQLIGVMGLQDVLDVALIRHAYVATAYRNQGIGGQLLAELRTQTQRPLLVGTWASARWAIRFYEKHGFVLVSGAAKDRLLGKYWAIPLRQVEESVVLVEADPARRS